MPRAGLAQGGLQVIRSGNNGYIPGYPILAGTALIQYQEDGSQKRAVQQYEEGLMMDGVGVDGLCDATSTVPVLMDTSATSCCMKRVTKAQLMAQCVDGATMQHYPARSTINRIGMYGSANHTRMADWIELYTTKQPSRVYRISPSNVTDLAPVWNETLWTCYGVVAGVRYEILTALQGALTLPQRKIVAIRSHWHRSTWRWENPNTDGTHDFPQCVYMVFHQQNTTDGNAPTGYGFDRGLIYPLYIGSLGVSANVTDTLTIAMGTLLMFIVTFSLVHSPVDVIRRQLQPDKVVIT